MSCTTVLFCSQELRAQTAAENRQRTEIVRKQREEARLKKEAEQREREAKQQEEHRRRISIEKKKVQNARRMKNQSHVRHYLGQPYVKRRAILAYDVDGHHIFTELLRL